MLKKTLIFCYLFLVAFNVHAAIEERACRVDGYRFELKCAQFEMFDSNVKQPFKINWYRIPAKARYPLIDSVVYIQPSLAELPNKDVIYTANALRRLHAKRDVVWISIEPLATPLTTCTTKQAISVGDYLKPLNQRLNVLDCKQSIQTLSLKDIDLSELYVKALQAALANFKVKKINVITKGNGIDKLSKFVTNNPNIVQSLVVQNPYIGQNLVAQEIKKISGVLNSQCQSDKHCDNLNQFAIMLKAIKQKLPKTYHVINPVTHEQQPFTLTTENLFQLIKMITYSDLTSEYLDQALHELLNQNNPQKLLGLSSFAWPDYLQENKINWPVYLHEKCTAFIDQSPLNEKEIHPVFFQNYKEQSSNYLSLCEAYQLKPHQGHYNLKNIMANLPPKVLIFNNQDDPSFYNTFDNATILNVQQVRGDLITYGCARDIVFKFINQSLNLKQEVACLTNAPVISRKWVAH